MGYCYSINNYFTFNMTEQTQEDGTDEILDKLVSLMEENKIIQKATRIRDYYVIIHIEKIKPKCKECGRELC